MLLPIFLLASAAICGVNGLPTSSHPSPEYDVLVIGGGPGGLSATSGLARVRRRVIMFDSGNYRNAKTRHMHDVIGNDGVVPSVFRAKAREQILKYPTAHIYNTTIANITSMDNGTYFIAVDSAGRTFTGRRVVLATGLTDIMPITPGVAENFGKGIYWCPWCDGFEHRDQPFGVLGPLSQAIGAVVELQTLNKDVIIFANGTNTASETAILDAARPGWRKILDTLGIRVNNKTIKSITRLQDGAVVQNKAKNAEFDLFSVNFRDGSAVRRGAFITNFPKRQTSDLGSRIGVQLTNGSMVVDPKMKTNVPGVWAVGDANSDGATNVPHAMFSGKRAAVVSHVELANEDVDMKLGKRSALPSLEEVEGLMGDDLRALYKALST